MLLGIFDHQLPLIATTINALVLGWGCIFLEFRCIHIIFECTSKSQKYRITECLRVEGTSRGHLVQPPPSQAHPPTTGCPWAIMQLTSQLHDFGSNISENGGAYIYIYIKGGNKVTLLWSEINALKCQTSEKHLSVTFIPSWSPAKQNFGFLSEILGSCFVLFYYNFRYKTGCCLFFFFLFKNIVHKVFHQEAKQQYMFRWNMKTWIKLFKFLLHACFEENKYFTR